MDGIYGEAVQRSLELLIAVGESYDAETLLPVTSAHVLACNPPTAGKGGTLFYEEMSGSGGKFIIPTTTNPACLDPWAWQEMGFDPGLYHAQMELTSVIAEMEAFLCHTCAPYLVGHAPRIGEHAAWGESSAVVYVNSVLGARTNREGTPSALAAGLTGRTPAYGYHLDKNRHGKLIVNVTAGLKGTTDYSTLGYFVGKIAQDKVPILNGIQPSVSQQELIALGAGLASSGSVALYHAVGVTPEAPTAEIAAGSNKIGPSDTFEFCRKDLQETEESLCSIEAEASDLVILGCPHVNINQIRTYLGAFSGRKVKDHIDAWILVQSGIKRYAKDLGYLDILESCGVRLVSNMCPSAAPVNYYRQKGYGGFATDSAKMCYLLSGAKQISAYYGKLESIVDAVSW